MPDPNDKPPDEQPEKLIFGPFPVGVDTTMDMKKVWPEVKAYHQKFVEADVHASQRENMVGGWTLPPLPPSPELPESQAGDSTPQSENSD